MIVNHANGSTFLEISKRDFRRIPLVIPDEAVMTAFEGFLRPIGYLAINEVPVAINQGFIGIPPCETVSNLFLLNWCSRFHEVIVNHANGSTFLEISKKDFRHIPLVIPDEAVMTAFEGFLRPLYDHIVSNERESSAVVAQRDVLLPKLVLGELVVKPLVRVER